MCIVDVNVEEVVVKCISEYQPFIGDINDYIMFVLATN